RPIINNWPNPRLTKIISPEISDLHAKANPCFRPVTMYGKLAGKVTCQNNCKPRAPRLRPAMEHIFDNRLRPVYKLMVTDRSEPITTAKRMALSVSPNHSTAMGSQQML